MSSELRVPQEADAIGGRRVTMVGVTAVIIIVASIAISGALGGCPQRPAVSAPTPPHAPPQIGILEQSLVRRTERGFALRAAQRAELESYGWVDRDAGIAQIPIDRAIDLVVEGRR
jgi:hypothetical protein